MPKMAVHRHLVTLPFASKSSHLFVLVLGPKADLVDPSSTLADCHLLTHTTREAEETETRGCRTPPIFRSSV
jgi:hypothetical protein